jgi:hypothetical protein
MVPRSFLSYSAAATALGIPPIPSEGSRVLDEGRDIFTDGLFYRAYFHISSVLGGYLPPPHSHLVNMDSVLPYTRGRFGFTQSDHISPLHGFSFSHRQRGI